MPDGTNPDSPYWSNDGTRVDTYRNNSGIHKYVKTFFCRVCESALPYAVRLGFDLSPLGYLGNTGTPSRVMHEEDLAIDPAFVCPAQSDAKLRKEQTIKLVFYSDRLTA